MIVGAAGYSEQTYIHLPCSRVVEGLIHVDRRPRHNRPGTRGHNHSAAAGRHDHDHYDYATFTSYSQIAPRRPRPPVCLAAKRDPSRSMLFVSAARIVAGIAPDGRWQAFIRCAACDDVTHALPCVPSDGRDVSMRSVDLNDDTL